MTKPRRAPRPIPTFAPVDRPLLEPEEDEEVELGTLVAITMLPMLVAAGFSENGSGVFVKLTPIAGCSSHPSCRTFRNEARYFWLASSE